MNETNDKKIIFSGIQPSGNLTIGNYLGAIKEWVKLQDQYKCYYCVVDLHSITVRQEAVELRRRCLDVLSILIAAGLDPKKNIMYFQSHVSAHAELAWILNCYTYDGELSRMTQFKEKSARHAENINAGLFTYPVLMAADILLYQSDLVPIGIDQKQHLELTRDIATRFNNLYGDVFRIPEPYIPKVGAKIMSLAEPEKKMSKSDENDQSFITILDEPDAIVRKIKRAVTDSENCVKFSEKKPGVSNLMSIYSAITKKNMNEIEDEFAGKGYGGLKSAVAEAVVEELRPIKQNYDKIRKDKAYLNEIMTLGSQEASRNARKTLCKVYKKVGLAPTEL